ncbi:MAG: aspartate ammonia-lyase [Patescibacteria group bacterium]|nr:aspartate ammonia-lyase [Patescibacteria group bacterium]
MRTEEDALGQVEVPKDAYFGAFTARAAQNFQISGMTAPEEFRKALGYIKLAAARANARLEGLPEKEAIIQAAEEFSEGKFDHEFSLDVFQAGAGTSYNMNANEIIANRANEILGFKKGTYDPIHPNDHVNKGQSSNDVIPTATRLALLFVNKFFVQELAALVEAFNKKSKEWNHIKKVGRTHLQDAVPITLGQEFSSYGQALENCLQECKQAFSELKKLGIGATAVGTGINAHEDFQEEVLKELSDLTGLELKAAPNLTTTNNSMQAFTRLSGALRNLAIEMRRIMDDLRLMSSGPRAGLMEITLPNAQPGSSIMPGKINPSIPECMSMICAQVIGADQTVACAAQNGEFELNWNAPLIMFNLTMAVRILGNGFEMVREKCIAGIRANEERIAELYDGSLAEATLLIPEHGYKKVAEMVKEANESGGGLGNV